MNLLLIMDWWIEILIKFMVITRLDTIQAVVANHLLKKINLITNARIKNAHYLDRNLKKLKA